MNDTLGGNSVRKNCDDGKTAYIKKKLFLTRMQTMLIIIHSVD